MIFLLIVKIKDTIYKAYFLKGLAFKKKGKRRK